MNDDIYWCTDCEEPHCEVCDPKRSCKECGRPLCMVCHAQSHGSDRRGLCYWCEYISRGSAEPDELNFHQQLMALTQEDVNRLAQTGVHARGVGFTQWKKGTRVR